MGDTLGIDEIWLGEHHFSRHGLISGVFSMLGNVAQRTKNARIGSAVVVLAWRNPIQVAEEAATIDILSGGRLTIGVGSGYQALEFDGMGVDITEARARFRPAMGTTNDSLSPRRFLPAGLIDTSNPSSVLVTPDTLLAWYRNIVVAEGSQLRRTRCGR